MRKLDRFTLEPDGDTWTDYDVGGSVYGDYQVAVGGTVTELQRYVPGLGQQSVATGAAEYFLGDQIGTTRFLTDESTPVAATNRRVYTAFGELVEMTGTGQTRYGYAGAWGYQEHDADGAGGPDNILGSPPTGPAIGEVFPFLHVGWRYYDPSTGRFLQRDPIGIKGGLNVYEYVQSSPAADVDADGLGPKWDKIKEKAKSAGRKIKEGAKKVAEVVDNIIGYVLPSSPVPAQAAPDIACAYTYDALRRHILEKHPETGEPDPNCPACRRLTPKSAGGEQDDEDDDVPPWEEWPWPYGPNLPPELMP